MKEYKYTGATGLTRLGYLEHGQTMVLDDAVDVRDFTGRLVPVELTEDKPKVKHVRSTE